MKTSYSKLIVSSVLFLGPIGCAHMRQPLLSTPAVSMTDVGFASGHKGQEIGAVETKFCYGDESISKRGNTVGLMDEVILKAQKEKGATYIKDARFAYEGACIVLEGTAVK